MARRLLIALPLIMILTACGAAQPVAQVVEVTRVVTRVVPQIATKIVIVTATPKLSDVTGALTGASEPTAVAEPVPEPTAAPEPPVAQPTSVPEPTVVEPTAAPEPLAQGDTVPGTIIRTIRVFDIPNEFEGIEVITAKPGDIAQILYRGSQWYQIQGVSTTGEEFKGWVYRDWITIAPEDAARIQAYPEALPVIVTKITQTVGNDGKKYWTGKVMNIGAKPAGDVQVEISLNGQVGDTETRADRGQAFATVRNLDPGQVSTFKVQTAWVQGDNVFYSYKVLWTAR